VTVLIDGRPVRYPLAGVGQYVFNLAVALAEQSADFKVLFTGGCANRDATVLAAAIGKEHSHFVPVGGHRPLAAVLRYAPGLLPTRLIGGPFGIFHSTFFEGYPRPKKGQELVSTIHDVIFLEHPELFPARNLAASRWALRRQVRDSALIICVSEFTRRQVLARTRAKLEQTRVVPLAASIDAMDPETAAALRRESGVTRSYALYVGNLEPRKDLPTLLRAWVTSSASRDFALILAGAPAYLSSPTLRAIQQAAVHADIRSLGYVAGSLKAALFNGASAFIYPSFYEGFGIPVLEAMHHGLPVIACNSSSIPEVIGEAGLLVPPRDPAAMSAAIDRVLGDVELRTELRAAGRARAAQFSWSRVAEETAAIYGEVGG
jgi:glycosyltransferase involved in cell wall biosynthesis